MAVVAVNSALPAIKTRVNKKAPTAMYAVENIFGANHDVWNVNVEHDYHEEKSSGEQVERASMAG